MDQHQRHYAVGRLDKINFTKQKAIKAKYVIPEVILSPEARFRAFEKGEYTLKTGITKLLDYTDISDFLVFKDEKPAYNNNPDAYKKEMTELTILFNETKDEIILGGNSKALKMLKTFSES